MALYCYHFKHKRSADYLPVIERLLKTGVPLDTLNQGKAPLHWAAMWGDEALVKLLLAHGARRQQVGDGDMLPGTYARMAKAQALEPLLNPGAGVRWAGWLRQAGVTLLQSWVLLLLLVSLVALGSWGQWLRFQPSPETLAGLYAQLLLIALALRANLVGDGRAFMGVLKASLRTFKGWFRWLVLAPLALGIAGVSLANFLIEGLDQHWFFMLFRQPRYWPLVLALSLCLVTVYLGGRTQEFTAAFQKYASSKGGSVAKRPGSARLWGMVVLAGLFLWPAALLGQLYVDNFIFKRPVPVAVKDLGAGHLQRAFTARDVRGSVVCTLPVGTALAQVKEVEGQANYLARVARMPPNCAGRLTGAVWPNASQLSRCTEPRKLPSANSGRMPMFSGTPRPAV